MTSSGRFYMWLHLIFWVRGYISFSVVYGNVMVPLLINDISAHWLDALFLAAAATVVGLLRFLRL